MPETLAQAYDVLLFDLDGVVYIGGVAIPGAPEALQRAKLARGMATLDATVAALLEDVRDG